MDTTLCTDEIDDVHIPQFSDDAGSQGEWDPHQATSSGPVAALASARMLPSPIADSLRSAMADTQVKLTHAQRLLTTGVTAPSTVRQSRQHSCSSVCKVRYLREFRCSSFQCTMLQCTATAGSMVPLVWPCCTANRLPAHVFLSALSQGSVCDDEPSDGGITHAGPLAQSGLGVQLTPTPAPHSAPPVQPQQHWGQQCLPQHGARHQGHSPPQQQPLPCNTADRQSTAPLLHSQAAPPSQHSLGRVPPLGTPPGPQAAVPQAGADHTPASSATCSDHPVDHSHSSATTASNMAPDHQSHQPGSVAITLVQDHQEASTSPPGRGGVGVRRGGGAGVGVSQGGSRAQAGRVPQERQALREHQLQEGSRPPQLGSQPQASPPQRPPSRGPQHVSQSAAQEQAQALPLIQSQAHHPTPLQPLHVPNPGVFGDEDEFIWSPDSPTPTLHYSPGPITPCDGAAEQGDSHTQSVQVHLA